jgi:hypothetical protein
MKWLLLTLAILFYVVGIARGLHIKAEKDAQWQAKVKHIERMALVEKGDKRGTRWTVR